MNKSNNCYMSNEIYDSTVKINHTTPLILKYYHPIKQQL